jgi:hypothetical protein
LDRSLLLGKYVYKRALTTFGNIIRDFGTVECELAHRQLAVKSKKSHSWFILVSEILEQYGLHILTAFSICLFLQFVFPVLIHCPVYCVLP